MEHCDETPRIVDLIASFGRKTPQSGNHKAKPTAAADADAGSPVAAQERRLIAHKLRPTPARADVLRALEQAAPSCLDASRVYRLLSGGRDRLTPGSVYRALHDLWGAGLLVRTEGTRGRAFYAIKPDLLTARHDTLRCRCGARLVFIEDPVLRAHLRSLAGKEGFVLDAETVFTITTTCARCGQLRTAAHGVAEDDRRSSTRRA
ncbi:Fur family ferric uptake transcriptional regulator [Xanthomonas sacchari]|uniref:Fur family transcriptional regulator n=1 Tax=Xanthomonas sacchari TaxID=56458 RepID=UPI0027855E11|nr:transcriptional repressor [Xanthomonas sacchari]MDQ1093118.1 Fur family ferric uptake transcriptional regulator [Xanthomonas sacchari]